MSLQWAAELAMATCKEAYKHLEKRTKAAEKKVQALRAKVGAQTERKLRHTQKVERLEESLR
jgi:hypothetical protein